MIRPWRIAFVVYALALTIGTHWPNLRLGTEEHQVSDKLIHAAGFGGLALLMLRARWFSRRSVAIAFAAIWAIIDELTQGIPALGRTVMADDTVASCLGIAVVGAYAVALRPRGGRAARLRYLRGTSSLDYAYLRWPAWALTVIAAGVGALIGVPISLAFTQLFINPNPPQAFAIGLIVGSAAAIFFVAEVLRRRASAELMREGRCLGCGSPCPRDAVESGQATSCATCGAELVPGQWDALAPLRPESVRMLLSVSILSWFALILGAFGVWYVLMLLTPIFPAVARLDAAVNAGSADLRLVIDASVAALAGAIILSWVLGRLVRLWDRQHERCVSCGYDLHATHAVQGRGVCPECGAGFLAAA